ncbi:MAG TPA: helix-turn-helix transcriptional regulator [Steroidobacteraceae bacterium]|nr:helix-turn-helix transcriptional regulator [Steroidobacteraceae bacterium]
MNDHPFGYALRSWRQRRHLSQLELAGDVEISTRHLSFVETGRSQPSREMVLRLAERLEVPLRERNELLVAAGYAPVYSARPLDDPAMNSARAAVELILNGHEPYPAVLVDRHWNLLAANKAAGAFMAGVDPEVLGPPMNVLRATLHPKGLAPRIANLPEWRSHLLTTLARELELSADPALAALMTELRGYPGGEAEPDPQFGGVVVPLKLQTEIGTLSMFSTTTVFGTPMEVTLSELMLEAFYPADEFTAQVLRQMASAPG